MDPDYVELLEWIFLFGSLSCVPQPVAEDLDLIIRYTGQISIVVDKEINLGELNLCIYIYIQDKK